MSERYDPQAVIAMCKAADKFIQELDHQLAGLRRAAEAARVIAGADAEVTAIEQRRASAEAAVTAAQARAAKADEEAKRAEERLAGIRARLATIEAKLKADLAGL